MLRPCHIFARAGHKSHSRLPRLLEKDFYKKYDYDADFVGHPLLDAIDENIQESREVREFRADNNLDERPITPPSPALTRAIRAPCNFL